MPYTSGKTIVPPANDASGRTIPILSNVAVIAPASEPMISANRPKNQTAEVGQNETANRIPNSSAPQIPIASTRFCIPSLIIVPPLVILISPTSNMPSSKKIGPSTKCTYFCRKRDTAGMDSAVVVSTTARTRYSRQRPNV